MSEVHRAPYIKVETLQVFDIVEHQPIRSYALNE